jgi:hypothetical protein
MSHFVFDLTNFIKKTENNIDQVIKKIAFDVFSRVILKTPVDTGAARANWNCAIGSKPSASPNKNKTDPDGQGTISEVSKIINGTTVGKSIYLLNNLPYIERLETGYSKQAPNGMVATTLVEFKDIADVIISDASKK